MTADLNRNAVALLGVGNVRCIPRVTGALASYFGERPLELRFWDADAERLDLFDRFARLCLSFNRNPHGLISTEDPDEALENARNVILMVDENCARKYLRAKGSLLGRGETAPVLVQRASAELLSELRLDVRVLSLVDVEATHSVWMRLNWPPELEPQEESALPHQILRYLNGGEFLMDFMRNCSDTPIKPWLEEA